MLDCRILERNFQRIAATEIGPGLMAAFASELLKQLQADCCHIVQKRDDWTATVPFSTLADTSFRPFNPSQLIQLTQTTPFFFNSDFIAHRALKSLLGHAKQVVIWRLDHPTFKGWILIGWQTPVDYLAEDIENALFRFGDKVLIHYLSLQRVVMEQQYRFLFSVVPQSIVLVNESDDVGWVNQAAIDLLNLVPDELRPPSASLSAGMLQLRNHALNQKTINETATWLLQNPNFIIKEWIWTFSDRVLSVLTQPVYSPYFKGRIWLFNDVTELYYKNQQLEDAHQEIENLISVIAHDLKSPLSTLSLIFNFLPVYGPVNPEQNETIEHGQKTIKRGLDLIDSIVYLNRQLTTQQPVLMTDIDLNDMLGTIVDGFLMQARQKDITLHFQKSDTPVRLHSEPELLERVLDNLLSNALKFSSFGRHVYLQTELRNQELLITLRDQGPGFSPADLLKLFKRFQRLSAQPTNNEGSSGLGLSIVKALTDKLGATIEVYSQVGVGTTFQLVFPAKYVLTGNPVSSQTLSVFS